MACLSIPWLSRTLNFSMAAAQFPRKKVIHVPPTDKSQPVLSVLNKVLSAQGNTHSLIDQTTQQSPVAGFHTPEKMYIQRRWLSRQLKEHRISVLWIFIDNICQLLPWSMYVNAHGCRSHCMGPSVKRVRHSVS